MTAPLSTRGYIAPSSTTLPGDPADLRIPFYLLDVDNAPVTGYDLDGVIEVSIHGAAWILASGTWDEIGDGSYYYIPTEGEVADIAWIAVQVNDGTVHCIPVRESLDIVTTADLDEQITTIANDLTALQTNINANVNAVAGEVWDEPRASHVDAGSFGQGVVVSSLLSGALTSIVTALYDTSHRAGRTFRGLVRRLDALAIGKARSLRGPNPKFYAPDGVTIEMEATQNVGSGSRDPVSVAGSETP